MSHQITWYILAHMPCFRRPSHICRVRLLGSMIAMYRNHWEMNDHGKKNLCCTETEESEQTIETLWEATLISMLSSGCLLLKTVAIGKLSAAEVENAWRICLLATKHVKRLDSAHWLDKVVFMPKLIVAFIFDATHEIHCYYALIVISEFSS